MPMTLAEFRKLSHRDFSNGAVLDEIEESLEQLERAMPLLAEAARTIERLACHQAWDASHYEPTLNRINAMLANSGPSRRAIGPPSTAATSSSWWSWCSATAQRFGLKASTTSRTSTTTRR